MYTYQGTLLANHAIGSSIQILDIQKDCFYSVLSTTENGPLSILSNTVRPEQTPFVDTRGCRGLAVYIFKSSAVFMSADQRGLNVYYCAPNNSTAFDLALFVEWTAIGVVNPSENDFANFLMFMKKAMLSKHFFTILSLRNKARKAVLKALSAISCGAYERYDTGGGICIYTSLHGAWNLIKGTRVIFHDVCLEQLTLKTLI